MDAANNALLNSDNSMMTTMLDNRPFVSRAFFAVAMGTSLSAAARFNAVQRAVTDVLVPATLLALLVAVSLGLPSADLGKLTAPENQRPDAILDAFPLLFMGWTYHGVVPRVVYDLEGDKWEITKAIVLGSTTALVAYLAWSATILGNAPLGDPDGGPLQLSVAVVSVLAVITSLTGVVLGFVNEFNDAAFDGAPPPSPFADGRGDDDKRNVALWTLLPPAAVSVALGYSSVEVDNCEILNYAGIFGSSVLFLILPPLMAWQMRYAEEDVPRPLTVRPMVPLGKVLMGSMYKAAGTLILEQGLEKLGVFAFVKEHWPS